VGTLEVGKDADLRDLQRAIRSPPTPRVEMTLVEGPWSFDRETDARRHAAAGSRRGWPVKRARGRPPRSSLRGPAARGARRRRSPSATRAWSRSTDRRSSAARSVITGGRIAAVGADVTPPAGADRDRRRRQVRSIPGLSRRPDHAGAHRDRQRRRLRRHPSRSAT
jgi:hypothetical protein